MAAKSTVTGTLLKADGGTRNSTVIQFSPTSTPYVSGTEVVTTTIESVTTHVSNGTFSKELTQGYYRVIIANTDAFEILVPGDSGSHNITTLVTATLTPPSGTRTMVLDAASLNTSLPSTSSITQNRVGDLEAPRHRIVVFGSYCSSDANEAKVASLVDHLNPTDIVTVGDNSMGDSAPVEIDDYVGQYYHDWIYPYSGNWGAGAASNHFWPVLGEQDYGNLIPGTCADYLAFFTLPTNGAGERYYKQVIGEIEFFFINSDKNEPNGYSETSTQAQWLQTQLTASTARFKGVVFHHSPYSSITGYADDWMKTWPLVDWGADFVLTGHAKNYERLTVNGISYFNVGTGGNTLTDFGTPIAQSQVRVKEFGALCLDVNAYSIRFHFVKYDGTIGDNLVLIGAERNYLYTQLKVAQDQGLKVTTDGVQVDFPIVQHQTPPVCDLVGPQTDGFIINSDTEPNVLLNPRYAFCLWMKGTDPSTLYYYNRTTKQWVIYTVPDVITPYYYTYYGGYMTKVASPTFSPVSGTITEGFSLVHSDPNAVIYYSINGAAYSPYSDYVHLTTGLKVWIAAFARRTNCLDSDVVVVTYNTAHH